jgi:hypothetical protein
MGRREKAFYSAVASLCGVPSRSGQSHSAKEEPKAVELRFRLLAELVPALKPDVMREARLTGSARSMQDGG